MYMSGLFFVFVLFCFFCMFGTHRGQKKVLDYQKFKLQMVVSGHVCTGKQTWALCKNKFFQSS